MRRRHFLSLAALVVIASRLRGRAASPGPAGFRRAADYSTSHSGTSLLIMQDGRVLYSDYPRGVSSWDLASGTKSFWGILALLEAKAGRFKLDSPLSGVLTEWAQDEKRAGITLRQLLTLTSGIPGGAIGRPPAYADALKTALRHTPGERFQYGPAPYQIFGEFLRRQVGDPLLYLQKKFLNELGIPITGWKHGADGNPHLPSGASLTAAHWARFGEMVRHGFTDFSECFKGTTANPCYGLTWWLNRECPESLRVSTPPMNHEVDDLWAIPEIPRDLVFAGGAGGQRMFISASRKLLIVRQARLSLRGLRGHDYSDGVLLKSILKEL